MVTKIEPNRQQLNRIWAGVSGLTVEALAHVLIVVIAAVARLAALGRFPLLLSEADTALAAWHGLHGALDRPALYSPLLFDIDLLLFAVTRASDAVVRLVPALVGVVLVGLPYTMRDVLGRRGALFAALALATSPAWLFFSRTADGQILTALATMLVLVGLKHYRGNQRGPIGRMTWAALALGLVSGAGIYTPLFAVVLAGLWFWLRTAKSVKGQEQRASLLRCISSRITRDDLMLFGAVLVVAASGLGLNPSGVGATVSLAGHWVSSLWPGAALWPWITLGRNLLLYEPLIVLLAMLGAALGLMHRDRVDQGLVFWALITLLLGMLLGQRGPEWTLNALLPFTLLAARGFERLTTIVKLDLAPLDWTMLWSALCLAALALLQIAIYTQNGASSAAWLAAFAAGLLILSLAAYGFWLGALSTGRVTIVLLLILLTGYGLHSSVSLSYRTGRQAHEGLVSSPTSEDISRLPLEVKRTSLRLVKDEHAATISYDRALEPLAGWYLRDLPGAQAVSFADGLDGADMLLTTIRSPERYPDGYAAQRLRLANHWPQQELSPGELLRWLIYRDDVGSSTPTEVQLWIRLAPDRVLQP